MKQNEDTSIYYDVKEMIEKFYPKVVFFYICGARGIGKSFSANKLAVQIGRRDYVIEPQNKSPKFLYLRKNETDVQVAMTFFGNPFKTINEEMGWEITPEYNATNRIGYFYPAPDALNPIGYAAAVSTFSNKRSVDLSDVDYIFYDEIVKEEGATRYIKNEGVRLMHLYETIARNRELQGWNPTILLLASNPIDLADPLLSDLGFTPILNSMIFNNQERYTDYERRLHIEKLTNHPVSERKKQTALYQFAKNTKFFDESITGNFVNNDLDCVKKVNLSEYTPLCTVENICVYRHKGTGAWYISKIITPCNLHFKVSETRAIRERLYLPYRDAQAMRRIGYDAYDTKVVFEAMLGIKQGN